MNYGKHEWRHSMHQLERIFCYMHHSCGTLMTLQHMQICLDGVQKENWLAHVAIRKHDLHG